MQTVVHLARTRRSLQSSPLYVNPIRLGNSGVKPKPAMATFPPLVIYRLTFLICHFFDLESSRVISFAVDRERLCPQNPEIGFKSFPLAIAALLAVFEPLRGDAKMFNRTVIDNK
jgi:hypothetical protein